MPLPLLEIGGWQEVARWGGEAVLSWRADWLAARRAGITARNAMPAEAAWGQVLVHARRARAGTMAWVAAACRLLAPEGRLLLRGTNAQGIATTLRRLQAWLGEPLASDARAHGRAALYPVPALLPPPPTVEEIAVAAPWHLRLRSAPGLFAAGRLDRGTALLLELLAEQVDQPQRVLDLGAGVGVLACAALARWPQAQAVACEGEAEALACLRDNACSLGFVQRLTDHWWDAAEELPAAAAEADLVLCNPPCHDGDKHSLRAGCAMLRAACAALRPGGTLLLVAHRQLPYERELTGHGQLRLRARAEGFKVLELRREA